MIWKKVQEIWGNGSLGPTLVHCHCLIALEQPMSVVRVWDSLRVRVRRQVCSSVCSVIVYRMSLPVCLCMCVVHESVVC